MRISFVNRLALIICTATISIGACSHADGRGRTSAQEAAAAAADSLTTKADLGRIDGSPSAQVWVVEISDFQCPYCKAWHDEIYAAIRDEFVKTGKVRIAYVNYPMPQHGNAMAAARAAMCAAAQGKFWTMHDSLFVTQRAWELLPNPAPFFETLATKTGVDLPTWKSCLTSKSIQSLIQADMERAKRAGVEATPSFIVGGKLLEGARSVKEMRQAINTALGVKQ